MNHLSSIPQLFCARRCRGFFATFILVSIIVSIVYSKLRPYYVFDEPAFTLHPDVNPSTTGIYPPDPKELEEEEEEPEPEPEPHFSLHLIVPVGSPSQDLCKLLLSAAALGYPEPVLANWAEREVDDPFLQDVYKVTGVSRALKRVPMHREEDLVLVVDPEDTWFQLRPEVLISRYYEIIEQTERRYESEIGREGMSAHRIFDTVIFGASKHCHPNDPRRPACWAVPNSTLPRYVFGPDTDSGRWEEHNTPRWLNSGAVIGPLLGVRKLFGAATKRIRAEDSNIVSDAYHFGNMFGEQSYVRKDRTGTLPKSLEKNVWLSDGPNGEGHFEDVQLKVPNLKPRWPGEKRTSEFHIGLDYESKIFQSTAFYTKYMTWINRDKTMDSGQIFEDEDEEKEAARDAEEEPSKLPQDILDSPRPLSELKKRKGSSKRRRRRALKEHTSVVNTDFYPLDLDIPNKLSWRDLYLGTNVATNQIFPILSLKGPKFDQDRDYLWRQMWYTPYGEDIIYSSERKKIKDPIEVNKTDQRFLLETSDGKRWYTYQYNTKYPVGKEAGSFGAFKWNGAYLKWSKICSAYEGSVFRDEKPPVKAPKVDLEDEPFEELPLQGPEAEEDEEEERHCEEGDEECEEEKVCEEGDEECEKEKEEEGIQCEEGDEECERLKADAEEGLEDGEFPPDDEEEKVDEEGEEEEKEDEEPADEEPPEEESKRSVATKKEDPKQGFELEESSTSFKRKRRRKARVDLRL